MTSSPVPPVPKSLMQPGTMKAIRNNKDHGHRSRVPNRDSIAVGSPTAAHATHLLSVKGVVDVSFMPECLNGVEPGRFDGWEHAENQPNGAGEAEGHRQCPARNVSFFQMRIGNLGDGHGETLSSQNAQQSA